MTSPDDARAKQLAALDALGQIEVDVPENRMTATDAVCAACGAKIHNGNGNRQPVWAHVATSSARCTSAFARPIRAESEDALVEEIRAVTAERDQARQMLADAPHGQECNGSAFFVEGHDLFVGCSCWKAGL